MATSDTPTGPFARQGIAIVPWSHNPEAVLAPDGTWVIYTLGPGLSRKPEINCTAGAPPDEATDADAEAADATPRARERPAGGFISVNFTIHTSKSTKGPWEATTMVVDDWNASWTLEEPGNWNPAPVIQADGSVRVMAHTDWNTWAGEVILEAPSWRGSVWESNPVHRTRCPEWGVAAACCFLDSICFATHPPPPMGYARGGDSGGRRGVRLTAAR